MNLALDRRLGAVGAATATVVTEAMLFACCLYALRVLRREDARSRGPCGGPRPNPPRARGPRRAPSGRLFRLRAFSGARAAGDVAGAALAPEKAHARPQGDVRGGRRHARKVAAHGGKGRAEGEAGGRRDES